MKETREVNLKITPVCCLKGISQLHYMDGKPGSAWMMSGFWEELRIQGDQLGLSSHCRILERKGHQQMQKTKPQSVFRGSPLSNKQSITQLICLRKVMGARKRTI
jgi:hypothetical protein